MEENHEYFAGHLGKGKKSSVIIPTHAIADGAKANELIIWYKKSPVKLGKEKTLLFEVKSSWDKNSIFFFTDRSKYLDLKIDPSLVFEILETVGRLSELVEKALSTPTNIKVIFRGTFKNKTTIINQV